MKTARSCESLNEHWSPKCGSAEIKHHQRVIRPNVEALWVIRKSQVAILKGFHVALDLQIGNTIQNFEPGGEIQFVKAHAVAELGGGG